MNQTTYPKRLIEVDLPIKEISKHCPSGEVHKARSHLHAAYLVGQAASGSLPSGYMCRSVA